MKYVIPLLILLLLPSCSLLGIDDGDVSARTLGKAVLIKNGTSKRVYYFVVGRQLATLIDWAPSLDPRSSVAAGDSRAIPYDEIAREEGEDEVVVYWWHAVREEDTLKPGKVSSIVVELD